MKKVSLMVCLTVFMFFVPMFSINVSAASNYTDGVYVLYESGEPSFGGSSYPTYDSVDGSTETSHGGGGRNFEVKVSCGSVDDIPAAVPQLTKLFFDLMKMAVPIVLVIKGIIDLLKSTMGQKEDEIKKGQQTFIKRIIAAALFFVVVLITQFVFSIIGTANESGTVASCINCFMNNNCG